MKEEFTESQAMSLNASHQREKLIDRLGQVWSQHQVPKTYQSIFTQYLAQLTMTQFSEILTTEISLTKNRQSFSTTMAKLQESRKMVMQNLQEEILTLEGKQNKTERDLAVLCDIVGDLREVNLEYAELLLNIHHYFQEVVKINTFSPTMSQEFSKLDYDNSYLKKSVLRKFILFSKAYDPFFLKHYEVLRTTNNPRLREVGSVEQLFTLSANFSYRAEKVHKSIMEYLDNARPYSPQRMKKYRIISPIQSNSKLKKKYSYFSSPKQSPQLEPIITNSKLEDSLNAFKLDRDVYLSNRNNTDRILYDQISIRKSSGDQSDSPSNHYRNTSLKSAKEKDYILPRLNTIQSVSNYKDSVKDTKRTKESSIMTKHYNAHRSINEIEERDQEIKSLIFPKKFQRYDLKRTINQSNAQSPNKPESFVKREISVQCEPAEKVALPKEKSPEPKEISIQTVDFKPKKIPMPRQTRQRHKTTIQSSEANRKSKFKKYQLKASNVPIQKIFQLLRSLTFNQNYKKIIEIGSWQNSIKHNQYYFHKFFVNEQLCAVSLCCGLPQGDILIKCWGPLQSCDEEMSTFLFGKYIEHIQRNTICKTIFYNNFQINQLHAQNFTKKKDRIYERERITSSNCEQGSYHPFLSVNFTSVAISKATSSQPSLLNPSEIPEFHISKFICFNYLLIINKLMTAGSFSDISAYYPHLPSIQESNMKILSQFLSAQPYNPMFKCSYCHLLTLKLRNPIKFAFFLADKGYILVPGQVVYEKGETIIVCLSFLRHNTFIYFGKGIKNAQEMAQRCRYNPKEKPEKISFSVRMFRKLLRGKMHSISLKEENTYGDLEICFEWRDFLKGKIQHNITDCDEVFDGAFYCLVEMQRELLFVFQVEEYNFI